MILKKIITIIYNNTMKTKINKEWHSNNKMPKNPSMEDRIKWHVEHSKNCTCRSMPIKIAEEIKKRK
jgi:hypothetical protein